MTEPIPAKVSTVLRFDIKANDPIIRIEVTQEDFARAMSGEIVKAEFQVLKPGA